MLNHRPVRLAAPVLGIVSLVWLMVGCVYLPWFERATLVGTHRDFRGLTGNEVGVPIWERRITRSQVLRLLGNPAAVSANGRVIAYVLHTRHGVWIQPLCFDVTPGGQHIYALGLRFDDAGVLEHHRLVDVSVSPAIGWSTGGRRSIWSELQSDRDAFRLIDWDNGVGRDSAGSTRPSRPDGREAFGLVHP